MSETNQSAVPEKASGMAIASLVLGILGFCCCGMLAGIPALIVGYIENGKINRGESSPKGKGFCIAGMILGVISLVTTCIGLIISLFNLTAIMQALHNLH